VNVKTKQMIVRLTPDLHRRLKSSLALEDRKLVDFFVDAAIAYLSNSVVYNECIQKISGGNTDEAE